MIGIVGYTGFVGSNLLQFYKFDKLYNSKNFEDAKGTHFDTLFFCGVPAIKWYANKHPGEDADIINKIQIILKTITCNKFILISTIDVYENTNILTSEAILNEDYIPNTNQNHTYGKNRYIFEQFVESQFKNYHIIRLPALFGKGLKKNIIFDLINNNQIENIPYNSAFQWYNLNRLRNDLELIIKNNIPICNLFTEPLETKEIIKIFDKVYNKKYDFQIEHFGINSKRLDYNILTKYSNTFYSEKNNYICDNISVLNEIEKYLEFEKIDKINLCVSNICVNQISQLQFAIILKLFGISKVQIAPTKFIKWDNLDDLDLSVFTNLDISIYSFQSITYTLDHLNIFNETNNQLLKHLKKVIDIAVKNNIKVLVFGCPKNRKILDFNLDNNLLFINFFKKIGDYCEGKELTICLENNSKQYNCNFINTIDECANLVRKIDKPNIKMMIDIGNAVMENDTWYYLNKYMDIIYNIDISNEYMKDFFEIKEIHPIFSFALNRNKYNKTKNLEMLIKDENELDILTKSIENFIYTYH